MHESAFIKGIEFCVVQKFPIQATITKDIEFKLDFMRRYDCLNVQNYLTFEGFETSFETEENGITYYARLS